MVQLHLQGSGDSLLKYGVVPRDTWAAAGSPEMTLNVPIEPITHRHLPPHSPIEAGSPLEDVVLVPFGATNVRISVFPELKDT